MGWYAKSYEAIKQLHGDDADLYAQCLAATSPMSELKSNVSLANKAFSQIKAGRPITGFIGGHKKNLERIARREPIQGQKVVSFYKNLIGDSSAITIDRWMMRHYGYEYDHQPTKKEYAEISARLSEEAAEQGMTNSDYQARLWTAARGKVGSFSQHLQGKQIGFAFNPSRKR